MFGASFIRLKHKGTHPANLESPAEKLSRSFKVTKDNAILRLAVMCVTAPGHGNCGEASTVLRVNPANPVSGFSCQPIHFSPNNAYFTHLGGFGGFYNTHDGLPYNPNKPHLYCHTKWSIYAFDLTPHLGQLISIELVSYNCSAGGHMMYSYFDAECSSVLVPYTNQHNDSTGIIRTCQPSATLSAVSGFKSYAWKGPGNFTSTTQVITASVSGIYSLTLGSYCSETTHTFNVIKETQSIIPDKNVYCDGDEAKLTVPYGSTCVWNTDDTSRTLIVPAQFHAVYSATITSFYGCKSTSSYSISTEACTSFPGKNDKTMSPELFYEGNSIYSIEHFSTDGFLKLYNVVGQEIYRWQIVPGKNMIEFPSFNSGIYFWKIFSGDVQTSSGKVFLYR